MRQPDVSPMRELNSSGERENVSSTRGLNNSGDRENVCPTRELNQVRKTYLCLASVLTVRKAS